MKLKVVRLGDNGDTSLSAFYIDGILMCLGVEDEERAMKVSGETRVPNGIYPVKLRNEGGMNAKYKAAYPDMHKGMLCITNAPDWKLNCGTMSFQYVLVHKGNTDEHTDACYLTNHSVSTETWVGSGSDAAYRKIYPIIVDALVKGEEVTIEYSDIETGK